MSGLDRKPNRFLAVRQQRLREAMAKQKVAALVLTAPMDVYYLTGFCGEASYAVVLPRSFVIISDERFRTQLQQECPWARIRIRRRRSLAEELGRLFNHWPDSQPIGLIDYGLTIPAYKAVRRALRGKRLRLLSAIVAELRQVKDTQEIELIRRAVRIAESAFSAVRRFIRPGVTERQVAARLSYEMANAGSESTAFRIIVASGPRGALPHGYATDRKIGKNDAVVIDWGAMSGFYCSDLTRNVHLGRMSRTYRRAYEAVLAAQEAAIAAIRPGQSGRAVDAAARKVLRQAGYPQTYGHGTGHGLGLSVHEPTSLNRRSDCVLKAGMVVTVEPGLYLPGRFGIRIEDDVLVTADGAEVLSSLPRTLEAVQI